jgi:hypothetical protein
VQGFQPFTRAWPPLENAQQETVDKGDDDLRHAQYENAANDEGSKGKREILKLGPKRLKRAMTMRKAASHARTRKVSFLFTVPRCYKQLGLDRRSLTTP